MSDGRVLTLLLCCGLSISVAMNIQEMEYKDLSRIAGQADEVARLMGHLSNPGRLRVLCALAAGPRGVCELAEMLGMAQPTLSQHLSRLRQAGLVESTRTGTAVSNRLSDPRLAEVMSVLYRLYCA